MKNFFSILFFSFIFFADVCNAIQHYGFQNEFKRKLQQPGVSPVFFKPCLLGRSDCSPYFYNCFNFFEMRPQKKKSSKAVANAPSLVVPTTQDFTLAQNPNNKNKLLQFTQREARHLRHLFWYFQNNKTAPNDVSTRRLSKKIDNYFLSLHEIV